MATPPLTRRQALLVAGGGIVAACTSERREAYAQDAPGQCLVMPESTEGPFYARQPIERADISGGLPGVPLLVRLKVAEAGSCAPARGTRVDIWHCDAAGVYSSFDRQPGGVDASGRSFLRGRQVTGASGAVEFRTIWPGWYPDRAPHMHLKIFLETAEVLTAQLFFPDQLSAKIYAANPAYPRRWSDGLRNDRDGIFLDARGAGLASVSQVGDTLVASLDVGIDRSRQRG
jgi:protocatechuate 3,4-dioxygenase beta subunit